MLNDIRTRFLQMQLYKDEKRAKIAFLSISVLLLILLANTIYLNLILLDKSKKNEAVSISVVSPTSTALPSPTIKPTRTPRITKPVESQAVIQDAGVKDYFIPLGSGTNQTNEWTDVPGVQATVDFGQYKEIKEIRFEASVYVPTANQAVSVRLYNVTDKHPVWYSEVTMPSGESSKNLVSSPVAYDTGSKVYQVQMKVQLQAVATLVQSRIHVILN